MGYGNEIYRAIPLNVERKRGVINMVREMKKKGKSYYTCEVCGFTYEERAWAEKCEDFCTKHHACSLEITSHAVQIE